MQFFFFHPFQPLTAIFIYNSHKAAHFHCNSDFYVYVYYSNSQLLFIFYEMNVEWKLVPLWGIRALDKQQTLVNTQRRVLNNSLLIPNWINSLLTYAHIPQLIKSRAEHLNKIRFCMLFLLCACSGISQVL